MLGFLLHVDGVGVLQVHLCICSFDRQRIYIAPTCIYPFLATRVLHHSDSCSRKSSTINMYVVGDILEIRQLYIRIRRTGSDEAKVLVFVYMCWYFYARICVFIKTSHLKLFCHLCRDKNLK